MTRSTRIILSLLFLTIIAGSGVAFAGPAPALPALTAPVPLEPANHTVFQNNPGKVTLVWIHSNAPYGVNKDVASYNVVVQYNDAGTWTNLYTNTLNVNATALNVTEGSLTTTGTNAACTGLYTAGAATQMCCTGLGTGTCGAAAYATIYNTSLFFTIPSDSACTASGAPYACCTGSGTGTCEFPTYTSYRWQVQAVARTEPTGTTGNPANFSNSVLGTAATAWSYFSYDLTAIPPPPVNDVLRTPPALSPANGAVFVNDLPAKYTTGATPTVAQSSVSLPVRNMTLAWEPVENASGYVVYVQYFNPTTQTWMNDTYSNTTTSCGSSNAAFNTCVSGSGGCPGCTGVGKPYFCCTGSGTGTCANGVFLETNNPCSLSINLYGLPVANPRHAEITLSAPTALTNLSSLCTAAGVPYTFCAGAGASASTSDNSFCTATGVPHACCTGSGTGSCTTSSLCTAAGVPYTFCSGNGTGTSPPSLNIATIPGVSPSLNSLCTASGVPYACCTGSAAGTCTVSTILCTGVGAPYACCTGIGLGKCGSNYVCTGVGTPYPCCTGPQAGFCSVTNAACTAPGVPYACCTGADIGTCTSGGFAMSQAAGAVEGRWAVQALAPGTNTACTASGEPYACCTGPGAGTCGAYKNSPAPNPASLETPPWHYFAFTR